MKIRLPLILAGFLVCVCLSGYAETMSGNQWSVWAGSDGNDLEVFYAHQENGVWSAPDRLNTDNAVMDYSPAVAVSREGVVCVVWIREKEGKRELYSSRWDGMKWTSEEPVGGVSDIKFSQPAIGFDQNGELWIVATGVKEGGQDEIFWNHKTSNGWVGWALLDRTNMVPDLDPAILSFDKEMWIVWIQFNGQSYEMVRKVWDGKKWSEKTKLFPEGNGLGEFLSLKIEEGKPAVLFYRDGKTFLSRWDGQAWSMPVSVVIPLESDFVNLWKNQGTYKAQSSWFSSEGDRGSVNIVIPQGGGPVSSRVVALLIRKFFRISENEAYAAATANVYTAFGDSITLGYPYSGYGVFLQAKLIGQYGPSTVINRGVGGEHTDEGLGRLSGVLNSDNPEFVLIMEGTNDIGHNRSIESIAFNLGSMIDRATGFGVKPIISTVTPRLDDYNGGVEELNNLIRGMAGEKKIPLADNYAKIISQPTPVFDSLYIDHLHFNDDGYELIAQAWFDTIKSVKGGGGGGGGGGCGSVSFSSPDKFNLNLEPLFFIVAVLLILRWRRGISKVTR